mgnify:CR=1 FL=1
MSDGHIHHGAARSGATLNLFRGCLVATLPADISGEVLPLFRRDLLEQLAQTRAKRVVIDCAGLEILDPEEFRALDRVAAMAGLLGAAVILAGLRPGIVASLITMGEESGKLRGALNLDDALQMFEEEHHPPEMEPLDCPPVGQEKTDHQQPPGGDHVR